MNKSEQLIEWEKEANVLQDKIEALKADIENNPLSTEQQLNEQERQYQQRAIDEHRKKHPSDSVDLFLPGTPSQDPRDNQLGDLMSEYENLMTAILNLQDEVDSDLAN